MDTNKRGWITYGKVNYRTSKVCKCGHAVIVPFHFPYRDPNKIHFRCTNPSCLGSKMRRVLGDVTPIEGIN